MFYLGWKSATKGNLFYLGWLPESEVVEEIVTNNRGLDKRVDLAFLRKKEEEELAEQDLQDIIDILFLSGIIRK